MISAEIVNFDSFAVVCSSDVDDNFHNNCKNTITFDSENLIIESYQKKKELCEIAFRITPKFIEELKVFVNVLEVMNNECESV